MYLLIFGIILSKTKKQSLEFFLLYCILELPTTKIIAIPNKVHNCREGRLLLYSIYLSKYYLMPL